MEIVADSRQASPSPGWGSPMGIVPTTGFVLVEKPDEKPTSDERLRDEYFAQPSIFRPVHEMLEPVKEMFEQLGMIIVGFVVRRNGFCVCLAVSIMITILCFGAALDVSVQTDFDLFLKTDVNSSLQYDAFQDALAVEGRTTMSRRLQSLLYVPKDVYLIYELKSTSLTNGILDVDEISRIALFENEIRNLGKWQELCDRSASWSALCSPGVTFISYALPSTNLMSTSDVVPESVSFDGQGSDPLTLEAALSIVKDHNLNSVLLPSSYSDTDDNPSITILRSAFRFQLPIGSAADSTAARGAKQEEVDDEWWSFVVDDLMPILREGLDSDLRIHFDGTDFEEIEILRALYADLALCIGSFGFVICYLMFHLRSGFLAFFGLSISLIAVPVTYVVCGLLVNQTEISVASFLALFLAIGFGCDTMLVYSDCWTESIQHRVSVEDRLAWTFRHGGRATIATVGTTALSFFSNLASVIRSLRQFGFFMGLCNVTIWVMLTTIFVPLIVMDQRYFKRCHLRCRREPVAGEQGNRIFFLQLWSRHLRAWRWCHLCVPFLLVIIGLCIMVPQASFTILDPGLFPEDHNRFLVEDAMTHFDSIGEAFPSTFGVPPQTEDVWVPTTFTPVSSINCALFWCESVPQTVDEGQCNCYRKEKICSASDSTAQAKLRTISTTTTISSDEYQAYMQSSLDSTASSAGSFGSSAITQPLLLQEWETGYVETTSMMQYSMDINRLQSTATCGWEELCFCSGERCVLDDSWVSQTSRERRLRNHTVHSLKPRRLPTSAQLVSSSRPLHGRRLQEALIRIDVPLGFNVDTEIPLLWVQSSTYQRWTFSDAFDITHPWTQRAIYTLVNDRQDRLLIGRSRTWIKTFASCLASKNMRFPVRSGDWNEATAQCSPSNDEYVWFEGNEVRATYVAFELSIPSSALTVDQTLDLKAEWDDYLAIWNADAVKQARGAFHVSSVWVDAESQKAILLTTIITLLLLLLLAYCGMLTFTCSLVLSLFVVSSTFGVMLGLALVILLVSTTVGLLEAVAVIYFIGYAVTYSLHIAHHYASEEALIFEPHPRGIPNEQAAMRLRRVSFSLKVIGGATVGSAITTAGAAFFGLFATLTIFSKLYMMCFSVTLIAIFVTMGALPAALLLFGPLWPGCGRCSPPSMPAQSLRDGGRLVSGARAFASAASGAIASAGGRNKENFDSKAERLHQPAEEEEPALEPNVATPDVNSAQTIRIGGPEAAPSPRMDNTTTRVPGGARDSSSRDRERRHSRERLGDDTLDRESRSRDREGTSNDRDSWSRDSRSRDPESRGNSPTRRPPLRTNSRPDEMGSANNRASM